MNQTPTTRISLILRIRDARDAAAWSEFVEVYEPLVYRLALRTGLEHHDAVDATQEVFFAISRAIHRWQEDANRGRFRSWLYRVARNVIVTAMRKRFRQIVGSGDTDVLRLLEQQPDAGQHPPGPFADEFDYEWRRQVFQWAANQICGEFQPSTWNAFWRTHVDGEPIAQTAEVLQLSSGAVYGARCRVLARLREVVQRMEQQIERGDDHENL